MLALENVPIYFMRPKWLDDQSTQLGCYPVASFLVACHKPAMLVSLGLGEGSTHDGFCQSIRALGLPTQCHAIHVPDAVLPCRDLGQGILEEFSEFHEKNYADFSSLIRLPLNDALELFADSSIELLCIHGSNVCESSCEDLELWLPKLGNRGIAVLLNTSLIYETPQGREFVDRLRERYPIFEFGHFNGLSIVGVGSDIATSDIGGIIVATENEKNYLRLFFAELGKYLIIEEKYWENIVRLSKLKDEMDFQTANDTILIQKAAELTHKNSLIELLPETVVAKETAVACNQATINKQHLELQKLYSSRSWRITAPLRFVAGIVRTVRNRFVSPSN